MVSNRVDPTWNGRTNSMSRVKKRPMRLKEPRTGDIAPPGLTIAIIPTSSNAAGRETGSRSVVPRLSTCHPAKSDGYFFLNPIALLPKRKFPSNRFPSIWGPDRGFFFVANRGNRYYDRVNSVPVSTGQLVVHILGFHEHRAWFRLQVGEPDESWRPIGCAVSLGSLLWQVGPGGNQKTWTQSRPISWG